MRRSIAYARSRLPPPARGLADLPKFAHEVAIQRAAAVGYALFQIGAIRSLQPQTYRAAAAHVTCGAAHVQQTNATDGQQAAHLLPGQISIDGDPVWALARHSDPRWERDIKRLIAETEASFADTEVLPAYFNKADTEAEGEGDETASERLKPLFADVVGELWRNMPIKEPFVVDRQAVIGPLGRWFSQSALIYQDASARKYARGHRHSGKVLSLHAQSFRVANPGRFVDAYLRIPMQAYQWPRR